MTIVEAVNALTEGKKIRRNDWSKGDYVTLKDNKVVTIGDEPSGLYIEDFSADCWEEYKEDILDEEEKKYLSAVIKPFRDRVIYIKKIEAYNVGYGCGEKISIELCDKDGIKDYLSLPWFAKDTMYKGMGLGKRYVLKELGL